MIRLELKRHGNSLRQFVFDQEVVFVGRDPKNDISFDDRSASRHHARIVSTAQGYELEDLGSRNGTKLNDSVAAHASLRVDDVIQIGGHTLIVLDAASTDLAVEALQDELDRTRAAIPSEPEPQEPNWELQVERDGQCVSTVSLRDRTNIGRDPASDVVLSDDDVSRLHATILRKHGKYYVEDRDSLNGTVVDGEPVYSSRLSPDTDLRIGPYQLRLHRPHGVASRRFVCRDCHRGVSAGWPYCPFCSASTVEAFELRVPLEPLKAPDPVVAALTRRTPLRLAEETIASERHFWISFDETERIRHPVGQVPDRGMGCPRCLRVAEPARRARVCPACSAAKLVELDLRSLLREWTSRGPVQVMLREVSTSADFTTLVKVKVVGAAPFAPVQDAPQRR